MSAIALTRVATLSPFCRVLREGGIEVGRCLERSGIPPEILQAPERFVPLRRGAEFVQQIAQREGILSFGFIVGSKTTLAELGEFGRTINRSITLRDALERFIRALPMADTGARAWTEEVPERDSLRFCFRQDVDIANNIVDGYTLAVVIGIIRMAVGPDWCPAHVRVHAHPREARRIESLADARIQPVAGYGAVEIPRDLLAMPFHAQPSVPNGEANDWNRTPQTLVEELTVTIQNGFGARVPDLVEAAQLAGMSVRTLQRRLKKEGYLFRELVDELRFKKAGALLADSSLPVAEIAWHLGYPDAANFTHAFRRWTGESPSASRIRLAS